MSLYLWCPYTRSGGALIAYSPKTWVNGDTLNAQALNTEFGKLKTETDAINTTIDGLGTGTGTAAGAVIYKDAIPNLRSLTPGSITNGQMYYTAGHTAANDGGGGFFRWTTSTPYADRTFTATAATDTFTLASHGYVSGDEVVFTGASLPTGITAGTNYWVIRIDNSNFKLAADFTDCLTLFGSISTVPIAITTDGTGTVNYADDNGMYIATTTSATTGRFVRLRHQTYMNARWWGFLPTVQAGTTHAGRVTALQRGLAAVYKLGGATLFVPAGDYAVNGGVRMVDCTLAGESMVNSKITVSSTTPDNTVLVEMRTEEGVAGLLNMRDLGFYGDSLTTSPSTETPGSTITAIRCHFRAFFSDVSVKRCYTGIQMASGYGHIYCDGITMSQNYYGVYFTEGVGGDYDISNSDLNANLFASIAVAQDDTIVGLKVSKTHLGRGPYSIYQEPGVSNFGFLQEVTLDWARFEDTGNAAMFTSKKDGGGEQGKIYNLSVINPGYGWVPGGNKLPTRNADYAIVATSLNGMCEFRGGQWQISNQQVGMMLLTDNFADLYLDYSGVPWTIAAGAKPPLVTITNGTSRRIHYIMPASGRYGTNTIAIGQTERQIVTGIYAGDASWVKIRTEPQNLAGLTAPFLVFVDRIVTSRSSDVGSTSFYINLLSATGQTPTSALTVDWWFEV